MQILTYQGAGNDCTNDKALLRSLPEPPSRHDVKIAISSEMSPPQVAKEMSSGSVYVDGLGTVNGMLFFLSQLLLLLTWIRLRMEEERMGQAFRRKRGTLTAATSGHLGRITLPQ